MSHDVRRGRGVVKSLKPRHLAPNPAVPTCLEKNMKFSNLQAANVVREIHISPPSED